LNGAPAPFFWESLLAESQKTSAPRTKFVLLILQSETGRSTFAGSPVAAILIADRVGYSYSGGAKIENIYLAEYSF